MRKNILFEPSGRWFYELKKRLHQLEIKQEREGKKILLLVEKIDRLISEVKKSQHR
jgi:hypothetical protein